MAIDAEPASQDRTARLTQQRRALPDQPGVYLFRDARGRVIYVGKAKSIRKRVASHFSNPTLYGSRALTDEAEQNVAAVAEEFLLQYYATALSIPSLLVVQPELEAGSELGVLQEILAE